jgi:hypothetical protein
MRLGLREFCKVTQIDPSLWSKIEQGKMCIPFGLITPALKGLKIRRGKDTRYFMTLASLSRCEVPWDIMTDVKLSSLLPLILCGMRDPKKLKALCEIVQREE